MRNAQATLTEQANARAAAGSSPGGGNGILATMFGRGGAPPVDAYAAADDAAPDQPAKVLGPHRSLHLSNNNTIVLLATVSAHFGRRRLRLLARQEGMQQQVMPPRRQTLTPVKQSLYLR